MLVHESFLYKPTPLQVCCASDCKEIGMNILASFTTVHKTEAYDRIAFTTTKMYLQHVRKHDIQKYNTHTSRTTTAKERKGQGKER